MKPKYRKFLIWAVPLLLLADLCATVTFDRIVRTTTHAYADGLRQSIAVVFFHDFGKMHGVDRTTSTSLERALAGYRKKEYLGIICVGGFRGKEKPIGSQLMRDYLIKGGVQENHVFADSNSFDTSTNVQNAIESAKRFKIRHLTFISDVYHLSRILSFVNHSGLLEEDFYSISPSSVEPPGLSTAIHGWRRIHHEFLARIAWNLLPESLYRSLIWHLRVA
jgi:vancomycin permeability regulator SanA